ncbi:hypothetical protein GW17_00022506 [Ensete ventricosum]|nr:hypothetical protein GW17_00022506 [Ensete ventricosum]
MARCCLNLIMCRRRCRGSRITERPSAAKRSSPSRDTPLKRRWTAKERKWGFGNLHLRLLVRFVCVLRFSSLLLPLSRIEAQRGSGNGGRRGFPDRDRA